MGADRKGESWAVLAMSEMGKGVWLKQRLNALRPSCLVIWDTNDEYDKQARAVGSLSELLSVLSRQTSFAVRYVPRARTDKALRPSLNAGARWCITARPAP